MPVGPLLVGQIGQVIEAHHDEQTHVAPDIRTAWLPTEFYPCEIAGRCGETVHRHVAARIMAAAACRRNYSTGSTKRRVSRLHRQWAHVFGRYGARPCSVGIRDNSDRG